MFYAKRYSVKGELMLAACDKDIVGKVFTEKDIQLDVREDFYKGDNVDPQELRDLLKKATIINLIGIRCVNVAEEMGLVENKIVVQGIPHVQIFQIE